MKFFTQTFCLVLAIQIILTNTTVISSNAWSPAISNTDNLQRNSPYRSKRFNYEQDAFFRNLRARNPARMLSIDLSQLMPRSTEVPFRARNKSPMNLLGIDISVLSRNPDPKIPIVPATFQLPTNRQYIPQDNFDPRYDRLPVIETKGPTKVVSEWDQRERNRLMYPFQHLPLNIVTTYHSIMTNKKEDTNVKLGDDNDLYENEKKYTADFILHLLYQLSSSQKEFV